VTLIFDFLTLKVDGFLSSCANWHQNQFISLVVDRQTNGQTNRHVENWMLASLARQRDINTETNYVIPAALLHTSASAHNIFVRKYPAGHLTNTENAEHPTCQTAHATKQI